MTSFGYVKIRDYVKIRHSTSTIFHQLQFRASIQTTFSFNSFFIFYLYTNINELSSINIPKQICFHFIKNSHPIQQELLKNRQQETFMRITCGAGFMHCTLKQVHSLQCK